MPNTFFYNGSELPTGSRVTLVLDESREPSVHHGYLSYDRGLSVNTSDAPHDGWTAVQSRQESLEGNQHTQQWPAPLGTPLPKQRRLPQTCGNTRAHFSNVEPESPSTYMSDHHPSSPRSVLESIARMIWEDRQEILSSLSRSEQDSLHRSLSSAVSGQTTIIIPDNEKPIFYGDGDEMEKAIAELVGEEMNKRSWAIQTMRPDDIFEYLLRGEMVDGDARHSKHRWLVIPSKMKLFAYRHGLYGLSEADRKKEMEIVEKVAYRILCWNPVGEKLDCACERFIFPSTRTRYPACFLSQNIRTSRILLAQN
jgi:hypothetical protein